jgi:hypothetical protein
MAELQVNVATVRAQIGRLLNNQRELERLIEQGRRSLKAR